jgi:Homeodomain-like domain
MMEFKDPAQLLIARREPVSDGRGGLQPGPGGSTPSHQPQVSPDSEGLGQERRFSNGWSPIAQCAAAAEVNGTATAAREPEESSREKSGGLVAWPPSYPRVSNDARGNGANYPYRMRTTVQAQRGRSSMLGELAAAIGEEAAAQLVAAFGGTRLYVPHFPGPAEALSNAIGWEAARRLAQVYGGDRVDVPNPTPRKVRILEMRAAGFSVDAIARELGCTRRRVFQVMAEDRAKRK